jgi:outer membrane protein assembly factor BamA
LIPDRNIGRVNFSGNHPIPSSELRALVATKEGEVFRPRALRDALALMRKAYKARGYPDWTPIPDFSIDQKNRLIAVIIDMNEGKHVE